MDLNIVLWIMQIVLAVGFLAAGLTHRSAWEHPRPGMEWMRALSKRTLTAIGMLEVLGAIGLIVPAATGILPILTPIAATGLALIMFGACVFHLRRPGEMKNAVMNLAIGLLALFVAYGRFVLEPLS